MARVSIQMYLTEIKYCAAFNGFVYGIYLNYLGNSEYELFFRKIANKIDVEKYKADKIQ